jgi:hypothetical protein
MLQHFCRLNAKVLFVVQQVKPTLMQRCLTLSKYDSGLAKSVVVFRMAAKGKSSTATPTVVKCTLLRSITWQRLSLLFLQSKPVRLYH